MQHDLVSYFLYHAQFQHDLVSYLLYHAQFQHGIVFYQQFFYLIFIFQ